jgi:hypothetical protein
VIAPTGKMVGGGCPGPWTCRWWQNTIDCRHRTGLQSARDSSDLVWCVAVSPSTAQVDVIALITSCCRSLCVVQRHGFISSFRFVHRSSPQISWLRPTAAPTNSWIAYFNMRWPSRLALFSSMMHTQCFQWPPPQWAIKKSLVYPCFCLFPSTWKVFAVLCVRWLAFVGLFLNEYDVYVIELRTRVCTHERLGFHEA